MSRRLLIVNVLLGIVSVAAKDLETGQKQAIQVTASSGLTQQELHQMIESGRASCRERV